MILSSFRLTIEARQGSVTYRPGLGKTDFSKVACANSMRFDMGVWYHYYSAASDESAAATIIRIGDQGMPPKDTYAATRLVDPVLTFRDLEVLLTGRQYQDVADCRHVEIENPHNDPDVPLIVGLTDSISAALADANDERLAGVAVPWSQISEFQSFRDDPEGLVQWLLTWLRELAALARRARERSERLYCWYVV